MDKEIGVTEETSPVSEVQDVASAVAESVNPAPAKPERSVENVRGEFERKFNKLQEQQTQMLQYLATLGRQPQAPPPPMSKDVSDDDLWALAQGGDRQAFEMWTERKADKRIEQRLGANNQQQMVENQLRALTGKYPMLNDSSNPLTQTAHQAYQLLVQNGYPANRATLLDAVKTAIAERPDIVSESYTQTSRAADQQRQSASRVAQAGQTGASHRAAPVINKDKLKVSPAEEAMAARMGVKDPLGAKKRFLERNEKGISQLGAVGALVDTDNF